ncbi:peptidyl-prolyl cis-trans isomerase [Enhygromyxa salina]|uniref:peptidyl-prolyl cis-trans isomerase n=1 Tax=Enhygromyxa salina TaxID=215803 RepID=UPI000D040239|nr:peptidyl-prolyl cis-trans isomerase [Enhygromyxa salina]
MTSVVMLAACEATIEGVPAGAVARVGEVVVETAQVEASQAQLDAFGQARFRGPDGQRALVAAIINEELLVQEARDAGLTDHPRVEWAVLEELAQLQLAAMLERRLPRAEVAADTPALRARYERERERFATPERRRMRVVRVQTWEQGERDLARLGAGELRLDELGAVVRTPLMKRDDAEFPAYHRVLFDPKLGVGDVVPSPVLSGQVLMIGEVDEIVPAGLLAFEDPEVQEQLVEAEREARLVAVEAELHAELAKRFQ